MRFHLFQLWSEPTTLVYNKVCSIQPVMVIVQHNTITRQLYQSSPTNVFKNLINKIDRGTSPASERCSTTCQSHANCTFHVTEGYLLRNFEMKCTCNCNYVNDTLKKLNTGHSLRNQPSIAHSNFTTALKTAFHATRTG